MHSGNSKSQVSTIMWLAITAIIALLFGGFLVVYIGGGFIVEAVLVGRTGPVETRDKWPDPLKGLVDERQEIIIDSIKVYQLCQGMDSEYVFRFDAPTDLIDHIVEKWGLSEVHPTQLSSVFHGRSQLSGVATPDWWQPLSIQDIKCYVCPSTLSREKGNRFQLAYSESTRVLYVHYWFNF
ncbi:MAG: hypothetical protein ACK5N9_21450 [Pirellula sp.]